VGAEGDGTGGELVERVDPVFGEVPAATRRQGVDRGLQETDVGCQPLSHLEWAGVINIAEAGHGELGSRLQALDSGDDAGQVRLDVVDRAAHAAGDIDQEHHIRVWWDLWSGDELVDVE